jgi:hypothetical protein
VLGTILTILNLNNLVSISTFTSTFYTIVAQNVVANKSYNLSKLEFKLSVTIAINGCICQVYFGPRILSGIQETNGQHNFESKEESDDRVSQYLLQSVYALQLRR